jgi:YbbR domain-containing protein
VDPKTVNVSVQIRRAEETRSLQGLPITVVNARPGTTVELTPSTVDLEVSGPSTVLEQLKPGDILVIVDVENAEQGIYQLPVRVTLPSEVRYERLSPQVVQVTIRSVQPTPSPTP